MRIIEWGIGKKNDSRVDTLHAAGGNEEVDNWTTVVTGANGTKKSVLLRVLLEGFRHPGKSFRTADHPSISAKADASGTYEDWVPVVALSGTPFDRFPRSANNRLTVKAGSMDRLGDCPYTYLGLKSQNGTMGTGHSMRATAQIMLTALVRGSSGWKQAAQVLEFLQLAPSVIVHIRRNPSLTVTARDARRDGVEPGSLNFGKARDLFQKLEEKIRLDSMTSSREYLDYFGGLTADRFAERLSQLGRPSEKIEIRFEHGDAQEVTPLHSDFSITELLILLELNAITVTSLVVSSLDWTSQFAAESNLSSGQWHLLYTALCLALSVQDGSLVLVDEPENSLHPAWQRQYIELLRGAISHRRGCHVVVATHSPLIASGVEEGKGNVIRLERSDDGPLGIRTVPETITFGWEAGDVYQETFGLRSTRAIPFMEKAQRVLALVRDGEKHSDEARGLAHELVHMARSLPEDDTMRDIVAAIHDVTVQKV